MPTCVLSLLISEMPVPRYCPCAGSRQSALSNKEFTISDIPIQMAFPRCVLEPPFPRALLSWGATWMGRGLTGPPPSPGGDQPAPASLESGPSLPGTQKAEEEGSEAAPGGGAVGPGGGCFLPLPLGLRGGGLGGG